MEQFTVYENPSKQTRNSIPYLLDVQNDLFSDIGTRLVIPMTQASNLSTRPDQKMCPQIEIAGNNYLLLTHQMASYPASRLKKPVLSLDHLRYDILKSIDLLINGF